MFACFIHMFQTETVCFEAPPPAVSSLGTVLEELFAGFLLEPVCTLSRHGLLHLGHVVLRLQRETEGTGGRVETCTDRNARVTLTQEEQLRGWRRGCSTFGLRYWLRSS